MYYLRTKPAADAIQFTVDVSKSANLTNNGIITNGAKTEEELHDYMQRKLVCSRENKEDCLMCSG